MDIETIHSCTIDWDYEPGCTDALRGEVEARVADLCGQRPVGCTLFIGNACAPPYVEICSPVRRDVKYVGDRVEAYLRRRAGVRLV